MASESVDPIERWTAKRRMTFLSSLGRRWKRDRTIRSLQSIIVSQGARIRELEEALVFHARPRHLRCRDSVPRDGLSQGWSRISRRLRTIWRMSIRYSIRYIEEYRPMRSSLQGAG